MQLSQKPFSQELLPSPTCKPQTCSMLHPHPIRCEPEWNTENPCESRALLCQFWQLCHRSSIPRISFPLASHRNCSSKCHSQSSAQCRLLPTLRRRNQCRVAPSS